jgi:cytochrome b
MSAVRSMDEGASGTQAATRQRIWDGPTRIMHWLLVILIAACWWTGIHDQLQYHLYSGYAVLWIALMRLYWGFFGSSTARFAHFVRGPKSILGYARTLHHRDVAHSYGHNPLGAVSVLVMLGAVLAVTGLGLFAVDVDGLYSGPLSSYVSFKMGRHLAHLHYKWFLFLLAVIALHLVAVIFYYIYKRQNLVFPMISGSRPAQGPVEEELKVAPVWRFALGVVLISAIVWMVTIGFFF